MDIAEAAKKLAEISAPDGSIVRGVRIRTDDDLNALVADVLWLVPAPSLNHGWDISALDKLCELAGAALGESVVSVFCRYRTEDELRTTIEQDLQYFEEVNVAA